MGIGDLSVPKEMQRIGQAFYGGRRPIDQHFRRTVRPHWSRL
jgi:hypothetical protein